MLGCVCEIEFVSPTATWGLDACKCVDVQSVSGSLCVAGGDACIYLYVKKRSWLPRR